MSDPPTFSRAALAAKRTQQVESAASTWERQIEGLIGSQYSLASDASSLSRQASALDGALLSHQVSEYASELGASACGHESGSLDLSVDDVEGDSFACSPRDSDDEPEPLR